MMERTKNNNVITLIALVVSIVVLLILDGVIICILAGENGIVIQSQKEKLDTRGRSSTRSKRFMES